MNYPIAPLLATLLLVALLAAGLRILVARRRKAEDPAAFLARLEAEGLLLRQDFRAVRAFAVEPLEDEGSHYYLELEDGRVLFLSGQYLWDVEPGGSRRGPGARRFPCTAFTVLRHRDTRDVLDLVCGGEVLEPELSAPPFSIRDWEDPDGAFPGDGSIITDRSYAALKRERLAPAAA